jgi:hypothetical protein
MNAPECKTLKDKYDECFQGWKKTPILEMNLGGLSKCDDCFQVSINKLYFIIFYNIIIILNNIGL